MIATDLDACIRNWNPSASRLFGYGAEELVGRSITLLFPTYLAERFQNAFNEAASGSHVARQVMTGLTNTGDEIDLSLSISPIRDAAGHVRGLVLIADEVTSASHFPWAPYPPEGDTERRIRERNSDLTVVNAQLLALAEAEHEERRVAEALVDASRAMSATLTSQPVLERLLDYLARLCPYDSAEILLWESPTRLVVSALRGHGDPAEIHRLLTTTVDVDSLSVVGQVLATPGKGILIPDTRLYLHWRHPLGADHVLTWLGVPLVAGEKIIGLCALGSTAAGSFTSQHLRLAEALAGQAAIALQNAWLFDQVRAGRERLRSLTRRLVEIQETERRYVARELHDEAGQALAALMVGLRLLEREVNRPEAVIAGIADLRKIADGVLEELHRLSVNLRPASLDHLGLVVALQQHLEAVSDRHGLLIQFEVVGFENRLAPDVEASLYRIGQEALTNVVRHARATRVDVRLEQGQDALRMVVEDNGIGFDPGILDNHDRLGVFGMRERAEMLGGTLAVNSSAGSGTVIVVEVPYDSTDSHR